MNSFKIDSRQIFRLASIIYANNTTEVDSREVVKSVLLACFLDVDNREQGPFDIQNTAAQNYYMHFTTDEIKVTLESYSTIFLIRTSENVPLYHVDNTYYNNLMSIQTKNIDYFISLFLESYSRELQNSIRNTIYSFLYELTTTNLNSYHRLLSAGLKNKKLTDSDFSVDQNKFCESDRKYISDFLDWDNQQKNSAILDIILCCLEYCMIVSGESPNELTRQYISGKNIYLDTNMIFRALGINGESRKRVVCSLLNKCKQANVNVFVSSITEREFYNTIEYYIGKIHEYPRRHIDREIYGYLVDDSIFKFYSQWKETHEGFKSSYFSMYVQTLFKSFLEQYSVCIDKNYTYNMYSDNEIKIVDRYHEELCRIKSEMDDRNYYRNNDEYYISTNKHDSKLVLWIERKRLAENQEGKEDNSFIVSSDKSLRYWDMSREKEGAPIVLYPSQFFALLLKTCGRAIDDLKSFISFINMNPRSTALMPNKPDAILAGISVVTEDIETQRVLVDAILKNGLNGLLKTAKDDIEIFNRIKIYAGNYLDEELKKQKESTDEAIKRIGAIEHEMGKLVRENKNQKENNAKTNNLNNRLQRSILNMARENTLARFVLFWWIIPILCFCVNSLIVVFLLMQLFFCDKSWNFAQEVLDYVKYNTIFGKADDFSPFVFDSFVILIFTGTLFTKLIKNPFNESKREEFRDFLINKYIKRNNRKR